ncbi:DUF937 domain-containing protein [Alsobacter sp. SYSU BS001988]
MINLFEMMQNAQGGQAVDNLARQFGLTANQSEAAVDALLPAFTIALRRQLKNPQAWPLLMAALSVPPAPTSAATPFTPFTPQGAQQGEAVLGALFGSGDLGRQVAAQAAAATGMSASVMQQMLPAMAAMLQGGAWKTFGDSLAAMTGAYAKQMGLAPGTGSPSGGAGRGPDMPMGVPENWGEILGELMAGPPPPKPEPAAPANPFDPAGMGELISRMMSAGAAGLSAAGAATPEPAPPPAAPEPPPAPPRPAAKAKAKAKATPPEPEAAAAPPPEQEEAAAPAAGLDALTRLIETGREVQQQHMRNLQAVMSQVWGGDAKS